MRDIGRRVLLAGLLFLVGHAGMGRAEAQAPPTPPAAPSQEATPAEPDFTSDIELSRAAIQVRRQAIVTGAMDLEPKEAAAFWPLYREYRLEMARVGDRLAKLLATYLEQYENLSDQTASKLLDEYLAVEKARLGVKTKFVPRFRKVLPPRKVARFFQVDNKLDALIQAELAADVPLVR